MSHYYQELTKALLRLQTSKIGQGDCILVKVHTVSCHIDASHLIKDHSPAHHKCVRPLYLHTVTAEHGLSVLQGCVETPADYFTSGLISSPDHLDPNLSQRGNGYQSPRPIATPNNDHYLVCSWLHL